VYLLTDLISKNTENGQRKNELIMEPSLDVKDYEVIETVNILCLHGFKQRFRVTRAITFDFLSFFSFFSIIYLLFI
jgi:hypothetical protein